MEKYTWPGRSYNYPDLIELADSTDLTTWKPDMTYNAPMKWPWKARLQREHQGVWIPIVEIYNN